MLKNWSNTGYSKILNSKHQTQTLIDILVSEAIKTSEIEVGYLSRKDVISSVCNNLNLNYTHKTIKDIRAKGIGTLKTEVQNTFLEEPFSEYKFFE